MVSVMLGMLLLYNHFVCQRLVKCVCGVMSNGLRLVLHILSNGFKPCFCVILNGPQVEVGTVLFGCDLNRWHAPLHGRFTSVVVLD